MSSPVLSKKFLLGFFESYPAAISVFELDGTIVFVNQEGCELTNRAKDDIVGKRVQDFVADSAVAELFISRIISKGYVETELSITQSNGDAIGVRLAGVLVKDGAGRAMGIVGMAGGTNIALGKSGRIAQAVQRILNQFPESRMLTVEEVATELRVSQETVRRWVRNGQLPCFKLSRGIRIPSNVIKDLIRAHWEQGNDRTKIRATH